MNPFKIVISDFKTFTWGKFASKGYSTHALAGAVFAFMPIPYTAIKVGLIFLLGLAWEFYWLQAKGTPPDYADARWGAYGCLLFSILLLF